MIKAKKIIKQKRKIIFVSKECYRAGQHHSCNPILKEAHSSLSEMQQDSNSDHWNPSLLCQPPKASKKVEIGANDKKQSSKLLPREVQLMFTSSLFDSLSPRLQNKKLTQKNVHKTQTQAETINHFINF